jgi:hypothetical protein
MALLVYNLNIIKPLSRRVTKGTPNLLKLATHYFGPRLLIALPRNTLPISTPMYITQVTLTPSQYYSHYVGPQVMWDRFHSVQALTSSVNNRPLNCLMCLWGWRGGGCFYFNFTKWIFPLKPYFTTLSSKWTYLLEPPSDHTF